MNEKYKKICKDYKELNQNHFKNFITDQLRQINEEMTLYIQNGNVSLMEVYHYNTNFDITNMEKIINCLKTPIKPHPSDIIQINRVVVYFVIERISKNNGILFGEIIDLLCEKKLATRSGPDYRMEDINLYKYSDIDEETIDQIMFKILIFGK